MIKMPVSLKATNNYFSKAKKTKLCVCYCVGLNYMQHVDVYILHNIHTITYK